MCVFGSVLLCGLWVWVRFFVFVCVKWCAQQCGTLMDGTGISNRRIIVLCQMPILGCFHENRSHIILSAERQRVTSILRCVLTMAPKYDGLTSKPENIQKCKQCERKQALAEARWGEARQGYRYARGISIEYWFQRWMRYCAMVFDIGNHECHSKQSQSDKQRNEMVRQTDFPD